MPVVKRLIDILGSAFGLAVTSPVLLVAAVAIRTTMGSPICFRQRRPGFHGEPFELVKFRTMRAPRPGEDPLRTDGDRLTRVGRFLRATSLDELPTLWNVLRGDMSLVGPRPLLMQYLDRYAPEQFRRHAVKPGVTGWAQINGRNTLSWEKKFELDVWYVDHHSFLLDLRILVATAYKVIRREGISHAGEATMGEFMGSADVEAGS
jgi:sugar transferase EpsL